jgi:hypothetical protein
MPVRYAIPYMKIVIPWVVAVLALGGGWFLFKAGQSKSAEITILQEQVAESDALRAEFEELKREQVSASELERLRKNSRDALRLRNEISQLRNQKTAIEQQAQQAQAAAVAAQAQAQTAQSEIEALSRQQVEAQETSAALTLEQQIFAARYGLTAEGVQQALVCINQLRRIEGAKQQWALENRQPATITPAAEQIAPYLHSDVPSCPTGGAYLLNSIAESPTCNQPGHTLAE